MEYINIEDCNVSYTHISESYLDEVNNYRFEKTLLEKMLYHLNEKAYEEDHIFDEDKSVRWNREHAESLNKENKERREKEVEQQYETLSRQIRRVKKELYIIYGCEYPNIFKLNDDDFQYIISYAFSVGDIGDYTDSFERYLSMMNHLLEGKV